MKSIWDLIFFPLFFFRYIIRFFKYISSKPNFKDIFNRFFRVPSRVLEYHEMEELREYYKRHYPKFLSRTFSRFFKSSYASRVVNPGSLNMNQIRFFEGNLRGYELFKNKIYKFWIPFYIRLEFYSTPFFMIYDLIKNFLKKLYFSWLVEYRTYIKELYRIKYFIKFFSYFNYFIFLLFFIALSIIFYDIFWLFIYPVIENFLSFLLSYTLWHHMKVFLFFFFPILYFIFLLNVWLFFKDIFFGIRSSEDLVEKKRIMDVFDNFDSNEFYTKIKDKKKLFWLDELDFINHGGYTLSKEELEEFGGLREDEEEVNVDLSTSWKFNWLAVDPLFYNLKPFLKKQRVLDSTIYPIEKFELDLIENYDELLAVFSNKIINFDYVFIKGLGLEEEFGLDVFIRFLEQEFLTALLSSVKKKKKRKKKINPLKMPFLKSYEQDVTNDPLESLSCSLVFFDEDDEEDYFLPMQEEFELDFLNVDTDGNPYLGGSFYSRFCEDAEWVDIMTKRSKKVENLAEGSVEINDFLADMEFERHRLLFFESLPSNYLDSDMLSPNGGILLKRDVNTYFYGKMDIIFPQEIYNPYFVINSLFKDPLKRSERFGLRKLGLPLDLGILADFYTSIYQQELKIRPRYNVNDLYKKTWLPDHQLLYLDPLDISALEGEVTQDSRLYGLQPELLLLDEVYGNISKKVGGVSANKTLFEMELAFLETEEFINWSKIVEDNFESWFGEPYFYLYVELGYEQESLNPFEGDDWEEEEEEEASVESTEEYEEREDDAEYGFTDYVALVVAIFTYLWVQSYGTVMLANAQFHRYHKYQAPEFYYPLKVYATYRKFFPAPPDKPLRRYKRMRFARRYAHEVRMNQSLKRDFDIEWIGEYDDEAMFYIENYDRPELVHELEYGSLTDLTFWNTKGTAHANQIESAVEGSYNALELSYTFWGTTLRIFSIFISFLVGSFFLFLDWIPSTISFFVEWLLFYWWPFLFKLFYFLFLLFFQEVFRIVLIILIFFDQLWFFFENFIYFFHEGVAKDYVLRLLNEQSYFTWECTVLNKDYFYYWKNFALELHIKDFVWDKLNNNNITTRIFVFHGSNVSYYIFWFLEYFLTFIEFFLNLPLKVLGLNGRFLMFLSFFFLKLSYLLQYFIFCSLVFYSKIVLFFIYLILCII